MEKVSLIKSSCEGTVLSRSLVETIDGLPDGKYSIYIVKKGEIASVPQLRLFWMWMTYLEYWSGESRLKWHDYYCDKFLQEEMRSTRNISTVALTHFMEQIKADAQVEYGVLLPSPRDQEIYNEFVYEFRNK